MALTLFAGIGAAVTAIVAGIVEAVGKKTVVATALVAALLAAYGTFLAVINSAISSIPINTLPNWALRGIELLPSNTDDCIVVICTSMVARVVFDTASRAIDIRAQS